MREKVPQETNLLILKNIQEETNGGEIRTAYDGNIYYLSFNEFTIEVRKYLCKLDKNHMFKEAIYDDILRIYIWHNHLLVHQIPLSEPDSIQRAIKIIHGIQSFDI